MFNLGLSELGMILAIAVVVFGPGKLPEVGKAVGKCIRDFKSEATKVEQDVSKVTNNNETK